MAMTVTVVLRNMGECTWRHTWYEDMLCVTIILYLYCLYRISQT